MSHSKPFHNTLNYASTANIEEVTKFYNLGRKAFEADFSCRYHPSTAPLERRRIFSVSNSII